MEHITHKTQLSINIEQAVSMFSSIDDAYSTKTLNYNKKPNDINLFKRLHISIASYVLNNIKLAGEIKTDLSLVRIQRYIKIKFDRIFYTILSNVNLLPQNNKLEVNA